MSGSPCPRTRAAALLAAVLALAPASLLLSGPASASGAVAVAPLPDACGLAVDLSDAAPGPHLAVVTVSEPLAVVPLLEPVELAFTDVPVLPVPLDAAAVPDGAPVRVDVVLDGVAQPPVELALPLCETGAVLPTASPSPSESGTPSPSPSASASASASASPSASVAASASPVPSASAAASPSPTPAQVPVVPSPPAPTTAPTAAPTTAPVPSPSPIPAPVAPAVPPPAPVAVPAVGGTGVSGPLFALPFTGVYGGSAELVASTLGAAEATAPQPALPPLLAAAVAGSPLLAPPPTASAGLLALLPAAPVARTAPRVAPVVAPATALREPSALDDLAPAAVVLAASLGGLVAMARRRLL